MSYPEAMQAACSCKLCARRHSRIERHWTSRQDAKTPRKEFFSPENGDTLIGNGRQTRYLLFDGRSDGRWRVEAIRAAASRTVRLSKLRPTI